jgi:hypothetical protein
VRWTGHIERAGNINEYILFRKTESKISPERGNRWDNNIKERGFVDLDCIVVQRDRVQWWVLVNLEMSPWGSRKSVTTDCFSIRSLLSSVLEPVIFWACSTVP